MFTLMATNYFGTVNFEERYLEWELAEFSFFTAIGCVDCKDAMIINATTGELLLEYADKTITDYRQYLNFEFIVFLSFGKGWLNCQPFALAARPRSWRADFPLFSIFYIFIHENL